MPEYEVNFAEVKSKCSLEALLTHYKVPTDTPTVECPRCGGKVKPTYEGNKFLCVTKPCDFKGNIFDWVVEVEQLTATEKDSAVKLAAKYIKHNIIPKLGGTDEAPPPQTAEFPEKKGYRLIFVPMYIPL